MGSNVAKGTLAAGVAAIAWVTGNLGVSFWVLLGALVLEYLLHVGKKDERDYWQRFAFYVLSTAGGVYLSHTGDFHTAAKATVGLLAAYQVKQAFDSIHIVIQSARGHTTDQATQQTQASADAVFTALEAYVEQKMAAQQAAAKNSTVAPEVVAEPAKPPVTIGGGS